MKNPQLAASGVYFKRVLGLLPFELRTPRRLAKLHREIPRHKPKMASDEILKKELVTQPS